MGSSAARFIASAGGLQELASAAQVALEQPISGFQEAGGQVGRQLPARLPASCFVSVADVQLQRAGGGAAIEGDADEHVAP